MLRTVRREIGISGDRSLGRRYGLHGTRATQTAPLTTGAVGFDQVRIVGVISHKRIASTTTATSSSTAHERPVGNASVFRRTRNSSAYRPVRHSHTLGISAVRPLLDYTQPFSAEYRGVAGVVSQCRAAKPNSHEFGYGLRCFSRLPTGWQKKSMAARCVIRASKSRARWRAMRSHDAISG